MRISARCDYACKALLELGLHWPNNDPIQIHTLSERQHIPIKYLVQILIQLKGEGFVKSARGKDGGYTLAKSPDRISLGDVIRLTGGPLLPVADSAVKNDSAFSVIWADVEGVISKVVDRITFADIIDKAKGLREAINYQI